MTISKLSTFDRFFIVLFFIWIVPITTEMSLLGLFFLGAIFTYLPVLLEKVDMGE